MERSSPLQNQAADLSWGKRVASKMSINLYDTKKHGEELSVSQSSQFLPMMEGISFAYGRKKIRPAHVWT
jgi:hypothetical protein